MFPSTTSAMSAPVLDGSGGSITSRRQAGPRTRDGGRTLRDAHWAGEADAWRPPSSAVATPRPRFTGYPFTLGVASGAPTPDRVVLWTRLAPEPLAGGGVREESVVMRWEEATGDAIRRGVQVGTVDKRV